MPTDMRVTDMAATAFMLEKAERHALNGGWLVDHNGYLLFCSETIGMSPGGLKDAQPEMAAKWDAALVTKTVVDGLRGDYSAIMDLCEHGEGFEYARKLLDVFECLYLSMHALSVDAGKCSCPGFWSKSVCWHVAFWNMKRGMGLSMGVRLGSFPIPGEVARLYLGIGKTSRLTLARPTMQNTPKRRKFHTKTSEVIPTTSKASSSSSALSLPPFHAIYNFMARQPDSTVEYVTPQGLFKTFVSECASSRERGCEHVAFLLNAVGEAAGGSSVVIRISHLVFVPQVARQQTVEADTSVLLTALESEREKHGQNLEVVGWIHDHHDLPDEPTIDFDCWSPYTFQKDNPYFSMRRYNAARLMPNASATLDKFLL